MTNNIFNPGDLVNVIPHWNTIIMLGNGSEVIEVDQSISCIYLSKLGKKMNKGWHRILYKDMLILVHENRIKKI